MFRHAETRCLAQPRTKHLSSCFYFRYLALCLSKYVEVCSGLGFYVAAYRDKVLRAAANRQGKILNSCFSLCYCVCTCRSLVKTRFYVPACRDNVPWSAAIEASGFVIVRVCTGGGA